MNIVIVGGGEFGYQLSKELQANHDIVIIDTEEKVYEKFGKLDVSFVLGNGASSQALEEANIRTSDLLIACTPSDEVNIIACWTAKHLANVETICFVNHSEYIESFRHNSHKGLTRGDFGLDHIIWPKRSLAEELEKIISVPGVIDVAIFARGKAKLFEYRVKETTPIVNKELKNVNFPDDCIIAAITRDDELFIPDGNTTLLKGDKAIFIGNDDSLEALTTNFFEQKHEVKTVTIIGGGTVGYMLAQSLEEKRLHVKLIEYSTERCEELAETLKNTLVLQGDGTDLELLQQEQIGRSDVLVSVTNNDEKNLLCSLLGKQLGVKKVLTRVDKTPNLKLFETVGVDVALSAKSSSVKALLNDLVETDIDLLAIVERGKGKVLEIIVPDDAEDTQVQDLNFPFKAIIGIVIRRKKVIIAKGSTLIKRGDRLIIFTTPNASNRVKDFFENFTG